MVFKIEKNSSVGLLLTVAFFPLQARCLKYKPDVPIKEEEYSLWADGHVSHQPPLHG